LSVGKKIWEICREHTRAQRLASAIYCLINKNKKSIKGRSNKVFRGNAFLKNVHIRVRGCDNTIIIHKGARLSNCYIEVLGSRHRLIIDEYCNIHNSEFKFEDQDCEIRLGKRTVPLGVLFAVTEPGSKILIGEDCLFSKDIEIRTGDSHSIIDLATGTRINHGKSVILGNHVWVGAHARILKGVEVKNNVIIATSSILTKPFVESNCVIGGIPAKVLKENVTWQCERIYK